MENLGFWASLAEFGFLQRALLAALIVGGLCSLLSVYVVLRGMAFIGQGLSHAAFGGVAVALFLFGAAASGSVLLSLVTAAFVLLVAFLIGLVSRRGKVSADSAIGIFFAFSMALGVLLVSLRREYVPDLMTYLFGSLLGVTTGDLWLMGAIAVLVLGFTIFSYKELLYYSFDPHMAWAGGLRTGFLHYALLTMLALTIVAAVKIVGVILVSAFLVIPGATARLLTRSFAAMMVVSLLVGLTAAVLGLYLSHRWNVPTGATIVCTQFVAFLAVWGWSHLRA
jgi:ABC-type Mn2+/Zn2+ transport system permease subunit